MDEAPLAEDGSNGELVPPWLSWLAGVGWRILATIGFALVILWLAIQLSTTTASILVAGIVAATFAPYVMSLRARGWGRGKAAAAVTVGAGLIIVGIATVIFVAFVPQIQAMIDGITTGIQKLHTVATEVTLPPEYAAMLSKVVEDIKTWLSGQAAAVANLAAVVVTVTILAGLLTFYFLQDGDKAFAWALPDSLGWRRQPIHDAAVDAMSRVGGYLRGSAILGAVYGVTDFAFLVLVGLPAVLAAPLSVLVFMANFIPYIGGIIATGVILLITYGTVGGPATFLLFVLLAIRNVIVSNGLRPVVYGKTVDLHPAVILMVLPAGAALAGIFGLFVAIPVAAAAVAVSGAVVSVLSNAEPQEPRAGRGPGIPIWVDRLGQWSIRFLVVAGLGGAFIFVLGAVPLVVATGTIGIILAATFAPGMRALLRRGWKPGRAALFVTIAGWGIAIAVVVVSMAALLAQAPELIATSGGGATSISDSDLVKGLVSDVGSGLIGTLTSVLQSIAGLAVTLLLGALLTFYFLRDGNKGWSSITRRFHGWRGETVDHAGRKAISVLSGYMISTGALSAFGAISQAIIMALLGLPLILPIAFLSFILGFIPYIGSAIGTILAFLVAVKVGSTQDIVIMGIWTVVFNIVQGSFVAPIVYGKAVSLHPAVVLICIPAGGQLAGVMGMFLAVPLVGIVSATWRSLLAVMSDRQHAVALVGPIPAPGAPPVESDSGPPGSDPEPASA